MGFHKWHTSGRGWDKLKGPARGMRKAPTPAGDALWLELKNRALGGYRFRRQHAVEGFVLDFYCPQAKLGIEVDGAVHDERAEADVERSRILQAKGITILRFPNNLVLNQRETVLSEIVKALSPVSVPPEEG